MPEVGPEDISKMLGMEADCKQRQARGTHGQLGEQTKRQPPAGMKEGWAARDADRIGRWVEEEREAGERLRAVAAAASSGSDQQLRTVAAEKGLNPGLRLRIEATGFGSGQDGPAGCPVIHLSDAEEEEEEPAGMGAVMQCSAAGGPTARPVGGVVFRPTGLSVGRVTSHTRHGRGLHSHADQQEAAEAGVPPRPGCGRGGRPGRATASGAEPS